MIGGWRGHPGSAAVGCPVLKEVVGAALLGLLPLLPAVAAVPAVPAVAAVPVAAAVPVVAAVPAAAEPEAAIRATYLCQGRFDAVRLTALFFNGEPREVVLLQGEQATRLPRQPKLLAEG